MEKAEARPRRRHPVLRALGVFGTIFVVIIAVSIVTTVTVNLGPGLRVLAATAGGNYLKREMRIGGLSIRLLTGTFIVDDFLIGGLNPGDRPFFTVKRIEIAMPLSALVNREILVQSVELTDWTMLVETWPNGRHSFPKFTRDTPSTGKKRFVTTVKWVHAGNGTVHPRGPRSALGHGRSQPRCRRPAGQRVSRDRSLLGRHGVDPEVTCPCGPTWIRSSRSIAAS